MTVLHFFFGFSCRAFLDSYCIFYLVSMLAIKMIVFLFFFHFFQWGSKYGYEPQSIYEHKNRYWFLNQKNLIKPFVPDHLYIYLYLHLVESYLVNVGQLKFSCANITKQNCTKITIWFDINCTRFNI